MTRIRFFEWLLAAVLVVGLHGAALTGLVWLAPADQKAALPPPEPEQEIVDADTIDIAVSIIGSAPLPDRVAIAEPETSAPAQASSQPPAPAVALIEPQAAEIPAPPDVPQEPELPQESAAEQRLALLQSPELPQEPIVQQGAAVLQQPELAQEQVARQGPAVLQEAVPLPEPPQVEVPLQEPAVLQAPVVQQGPAVLQDQSLDTAGNATQVTEAVPEPVEKAPPLQQNQFDAPGGSISDTTEVAALPAEVAPPAASLPQPEQPQSAQPQSAQPKPAQPKPVSTSPLRDPVPIPKRKPVIRQAAPKPVEQIEPLQPVEPAVAAPTERIEVAELSDPTDTSEPEVNVLTPDRPATEAQEDYFRSLIERIRGALIYPDEAVRDGKEGIVDLQIVVKKDGRIASYDIITGSGHKELDDAAIQTLIKVNPVPAFPEDVTTDELRISVPLRYLIDRS